MDQTRLETRIRILRETGIEGRVALEFLAASDEVLFHGSSRAKLALLLPQQAKVFRRTTGRTVNHGPPAVHATPNVDLAIFYALIGLEDVRDGFSFYVSGFDIVDGQVRLAASCDVIENASSPSRSGWVYVVAKGLFESKNEAVATSTQPVIPLARVRVSGLDLPTGICVEPLPLRRADVGPRTTS